MTLERFSLADEFKNPELERCLLATIAANSGSYFDVIDLLSLDVFTEQRQQFEDLAIAIEDNKPLPTIVGEPVADPVEASKQLADLYQRRLLADLATDLLTQLRSERPATDLSSIFEQGINQVQRSVREYRTGSLTSVPDLFSEIIAEARERYQQLQDGGKSIAGISTGFTTLDRLTSGLQQGLYCLAGEPGVGKTSFALRMAANITAQGIPCCFLSFEEQLKKVSGKVLCGSAKIPYTRYMDGYGNPDDLAAAADAHGHHLRWFFTLEGNSRTTVAQLKSKLLRIIHQTKSPRVVVFCDYLQKWSASTKMFTDFRHVVAGLAADLRELSLRLDCPMVLISSQNRSGLGQAHLATLKESGDLEYSADLVAIACEDHEQFVSPPERAVRLSIVKNRYGDRGAINLRFRPDLGTFEEATADTTSHNTEEN